ncbi:MAG: response regulator [Phycisphaerales bacterium]|nr:response regulator [Phycisphaerales bacterium]
MADANGWIYWYNRRWYEYTGKTPDEMEGWGWQSVHDPETLPKVLGKWKDSLATGEPFDMTFPLRGADGVFRPFLTRVLPLKDDGGRVIHWFGTNTDVTEQRELQEQISHKSEQLAEESRRKDEFLAMLSHELRNPLAPIRSAVHILRTHERGSENLVQQQAREIIERQVGNLAKLVDDLLEVSRVISGRIRLDSQTIDLTQVVQHALETTKPLIDQHKHTVSIDFCAGPLWVSADAMRLEEVFINLLNNAAKYTPAGGRIDVRCEQPDGSRKLRVRVRDNGVGIDQGLLPRVFDLFTQADRSLARSAGGLGIGLSLARRLVELHGGAIEAHSPPEGRNVGSEFIVTLPLAPAPETPPPFEADPQAHHQRPGGFRVLVVDDNIDQVMMLASTLRHNGYSVQSAYTGPDGLKVAQQWRPDVVLLDIGLPGLDGYEVARRLRADAATGDAKLIALTGYGREADFSLSREVGFDAHLVKPATFDELHRLIAAPRA